MSSSKLRKPDKLRPAGNVKWAEIADGPPSFIRQASSGRRKLGVQYERRVHLHVLATLKPMQVYWPSPWLRFVANDESKWRWCQPDGLLFDLAGGTLTILEMKYTHTEDAWWWPTLLYQPVVRHLFPSSLWRIELCEVTRSYDCATSFPVPVQMVRRLDDLQPGRFGVLQLKEMCYDE